MRQKNSGPPPMVRSRRRSSGAWWRRITRFRTPPPRRRGRRLLPAFSSGPLPAPLRRLSLSLGLALLVMAVVGVAADAAYEPVAQGLRNATWLRLRAIHVTGCRSVAEKAILECTDDLPGRNIFEIDPQAVAARVEAIPRIRAAHVQRRYFSGALQIRVEERVPLALLVSATGELEEVDAEGVRTAIEAGRSPHDLPFIVAGAAADTTGLLGACRLLAALQEKGLGVLMSEISIRDPRHPTGVTIDSATRIQFSSLYPATIQAEHLAVVLKTLGESGIVAESIDLRFPGRAEVMPRKSDAAASPGLSKRG